MCAIDTGTGLCQQLQFIAVSAIGHTVYLQPVVLRVHDFGGYIGRGQGQAEVGRGRETADTKAVNGTDLGSVGFISHRKV